MNQKIILAAEASIALFLSYLSFVENIYGVQVFQAVLSYIFAGMLAALLFFLTRYRNLIPFRSPKSTGYSRAVSVYTFVLCGLITIGFMSIGWCGTALVTFSLPILRELVIIQMVKVLDSTEESV